MYEQNTSMMNIPEQNAFLLPAMVEGDFSSEEIAEDADGLEEYARWCEDEMHRHAMAFLTDWADNGRNELCRLTRKLSPSAGDPLPLLRPDD